MNFLKLAIVLVCVWQQAIVEASKPLKAIAVLTIVEGNVRGNITFNQASCTEPTHVTILMEGLTPGKHGFHIHELGNIAGGCATVGSHFNPEGFAHGAKDAEVRHVGDLGNVVADEFGVVRDTFSDNLIRLSGKNSIIGRAVVTHALEDDHGLGGDLESTKTGNAGARVGCGVIGLAEGAEGPIPECSGVSSVQALLTSTMAMAVLAVLLTYLY